MLCKASYSKENGREKTLAAIVLAAVALPAAPAFADPPPWAPAHGKRAKDRGLYDSYGRYYEPRRLSYNDRIWRGDDGRYHCRRDNGTTGLIIRAAVGALAARTARGAGIGTAPSADRERRHVH